MNLSSRRLVKHTSPQSVGSSNERSRQSLDYREAHGVYSDANAPQAELLSYGQIVTGAITAIGQVVTYTFTASAGDAILVGLSDNSGAFGPEVRLYAPDGSLVTSVGAAGYINHVELTRTVSVPGTYLLLVDDASGTNTASYGLYLQRLNGPANATPFAYGQLLTGTVALLSEADTYTFAASAGDAILVGLSDNSGAFGPEVRLYAPDGSLVTSVGAAGYINHVELTRTVSVPGTYLLLVDDASGTNTASYGLYLQRLNGPANATPFAYGQLLTGTVALLSEADTYTFAASAGDAILVGLSDNSGAFGPEVRLYAPDGSLVTSVGAAGYINHVELTHTVSVPGTYLLLVDDASGTNTASYGLYLQRLNGPANATPFAYGQLLTGTVALLSEADTYTFAASAGDAILVGLSDNSGAFGPEMRLYAPDGSLVTSVGAAGYINHVELTRTLSVPGTYLLLVDDASGTNTASYGLYLQRLNGPANATPFAYGQLLTGTVALLSEADTYTFAASAGDAILVGLSDNSGAFGPEVRLYAPDGSLVTSVGAAGYINHVELTRTVSVPGTYLLLVDDASGTNTASYGLYLQRLNGPANATPFAYGQLLTGTVALLSEADTYTFAASAGDAILVGLSDNSGAFGPEVRLYAPDGSLVTSVGAAGYINHVELTRTVSVPGTYLLLVDDASGTNTASYGLYLQRLNGPANATPFAYGQLLTGTVALLSEADTYTFAASAGDAILVGLSDNSGAFGPEVRLYAPDGSLVTSVGAAGYINHVELTRTVSVPGTYLLLVDDASGTNTASYGLYLQRLNGPANATPIYSGQTHTGTIAHMAGMDAYVFHADEDEALHIRVQRVSGGMQPEARLHSPNGELLTSRWNASRVEITDTVTTFTGQQTLLIGDYGGTQTGVYTLTLTLLGATPLALGKTATGLIHKYEILFYAVAVEDAGQPLLVEIKPLTRTNQLWVQGRFGGLPIGGRYDFQTLSRTARGTYELLIVPTQAGTYYFSLFGADVTMPDGAYQITARIAPQHLSDFNPRSAGNKGEVTFNLSGLGFTNGMQVQLRKTGSPTLVADSVTVASPTTLWAHFNLSGTATGRYNVVGVWPGNVETSITNAFTITTGIGPRLEAQLIVPETVRRGRQAVAWVEYTNTGDANMPAPLFVISATSSVLLSLSPEGAYTAEPVQALGVNFDQPAGTLSPGATYRIPIYFIPNLAGQIEFILSEMAADATPINWNAIEPEVRPPDIPDELWDVIWANFITRVGTTWADYLSVLDAQATYLAQYSSLTYDVSELFSAILGRASGAYLRQTLAASVDAYTPARGLPLAFSRAAFDTFAQRFTVGPLGRGWSHNWEYALTQPITDTIVIKGPGGGSRSFVKDGTGTWRSTAGDFARLEPHRRRGVSPARDGWPDLAVRCGGPPVLHRRTERQSHHVGLHIGPADGTHAFQRPEFHARLQRARPHQPDHRSRRPGDAVQLRRRRRASSKRDRAGADHHHLCLHLD